MYKWLLTSLFLSHSLFALPGSDYMEKFSQYRYWSTHLPPQYQPQLAQFVNQKGPLAHKLRDRWLLFLGEKQNWSLLAKIYRPTPSIHIQCYAAYAFWHEHQYSKAIQIATPLWLVGHQQPIACDRIFHELNQNSAWRSKYRIKRIQLALDQQNLLLARQLLNRGGNQDKIASQTLAQLHQQPEKFQKIAHGPWSGEESLYALERMIVLNRSLTHIKNFYQKAKLNHDEKQRFIRMMSLYLAMRNQSETTKWFAQVEPRYYTEQLLEWQMRFGLLHQKWLLVQTSIQKMKKPYTPEQTYWLARAELHLNKKELALSRLKKLANERSYYGFLASIYLHRAPAFQEKYSCRSHQELKPYTALLEEIRIAYRQQYLGKASQLLNDFILELPKNSQCALVDWVSNTLQWPNQAIYMSNQPQLFNQISVRFPTQYSQIVNQNAQTNHLPPEFIYSIIRQESAFHPQIVSPVGARGLMQMMPRTAKLISQRYRITYRNEKELFIPQKNIQLGTRYLGDLHQHLKHPLLVAAAYNAGPGAVQGWVKKYPAPDIITWIDTLPWRETRNYLKNIVAFNAIYQHRLNKPVTLKEVLKPLPGQRRIV